MQRTRQPVFEDSSNDACVISSKESRRVGDRQTLLAPGRDLKRL